MRTGLLLLLLLLLLSAGSRRCACCVCRDRPFFLFFNPFVTHQGYWDTVPDEDLALYHDLNERPELDFSVGVGLRVSF